MTQKEANFVVIHRGRWFRAAVDSRCTGLKLGGVRETSSISSSSPHSERGDKDRSFVLQLLPEDTTNSCNWTNLQIHTHTHSLIRRNHVPVCVRMLKDKEATITLHWTTWHSKHTKTCWTHMYMGRTTNTLPGEEFTWQIANKCIPVCCE